MRQDAAGDSMFVVLSGQARVVLEPSGQEVAVIPAGGFFGEMSMLTGDRRTRHGQGDGRRRGAGDFSRATSARSRWRMPALIDHVSTIMSDAPHRPGRRARHAPRRSPRPKRSRPSWRACVDS